MLANSIESLNLKIAELQNENALLKRQLRNNEISDIVFRIDLPKPSHVAVPENNANEFTEYLVNNQSDNWFKSIFENAVIGIVFKDINGKVLLVNKAFEKLIGYSINEIKGKNIESFTYKKDLNKENEIFNHAMAEKKENYSFEKRYVHKNNSTVFVEISVSIISNTLGEPLYLVSVINDLTEKKANEANLIRALEFNEKINQTSPVGIVQTDKDGVFVFANRKAEEVLGLKKSGIMERAYNSPEWEITDFSGLPFPNEKLPFSIVKQSGNSVYDIQHAIRWPNGKIIYLSINASPQFENLQFSGMIATVEDITKRVLFESEFKENYQFRNTIIRNAAEGLCVAYNRDEFPHVYFTIWNDQMTKITGYTIDEINELGWYQSLYPNDETRKMAMERMLKLRGGDDIVAEEWPFITKNKEHKIMSISSSIINSENNKRFVMALVTDVTEKNKYLETIEKQNKTLLELNATKNKFFSIISHDLRGPVGQFYSISELLYNERKELEVEQVDFFLKSMMNSSAKVQLLLNDLLNWTRSQMNKLELSPELIKINELFTDTLFMIEDTIKAKEITVETMDNDLSVVADINSIKTVLRNLLFNAIKFSYRKGKVKLSATKGNENNVNIAIVDQGVGVPKERIDTLFQIEKLDSTSGTENEMGTGLGLSICKEFIEKNNGKIWLESEVGKGSTFFFSLPC